MVVLITNCGFCLSRMELLVDLDDALAVMYQTARGRLNFCSSECAVARESGLDRAANKMATTG